MRMFEITMGVSSKLVFLGVSQIRNAPLGDKPGGALCLILFVLSVLEAKLVHDFIFRRLELPWAAVFNGETYQPAPWGAAHAAASKYLYVYFAPYF